MSERKIGYKGVTKDLRSNYSSSVRFDVSPDKIYTITHPEELYVCTNRGYHYCNTLQQVFQFYPNNGANRYFEIEILGDYKEDTDKCITRSFRFLRELNQKEIELGIKKTAFKEPLRILRELQTKNPYLHVGGSIALYLRGAWLKRWADSHKDLDLIMPFYFNFGDTVDSYTISGNDFDDVISMDGYKCDIKIDNKQRYDVIEFDGFKYNVSKLDVILQAKLKYSISNTKSARKHKTDMEELLNLKQWWISDKKETTPVEETEFPF